MSIEQSLFRIAVALERIAVTLDGADPVPIQAAPVKAKSEQPVVPPVVTRGVSEMSARAEELSRRAAAPATLTGPEQAAQARTVASPQAPQPPTGDPMAGFVQGRAANGAAVLQAVPAQAAPAQAVPVQAAPAQTETEPVKRGRGRPPGSGKAAQAAPPAAVAPPTDVSAPATPMPPSAAQQVPDAALAANETLDSLRTWMTQQARAKGLKKVQDAVKSFGVDSVMSLKAEQYPALRKHIEAIA